MHSFNDAPLLSAAADTCLEVAVDPFQRQEPSIRERPWAWRKALGLRGPAHALLADANGVWAWKPDDSFASATRHGSLRAWMRSNDGADVRLWIAAEPTPGSQDFPARPPRDEGGPHSTARRRPLQRRGDVAAAWPVAGWSNGFTDGAVALAGFDLPALHRLGAESNVRIRSVAPWWYHSFVVAGLCVPRVTRAASARVWVVEGRAATSIELSHGQMRRVRHSVLADTSVASLRATMALQCVEPSGAHNPTVVLGQGLVDGANTSGIEALVLGRLDGVQPPQWLRPALQNEVH